MPAAAVIPAPIAYIKVVAVETLVVELLTVAAAAGSARVWLTCVILWQDGAVLNWAVSLLHTVTLNKLECLRQTFVLNTLAWNNEDGLRSFFVGSRTRVTINRDSWGHSYLIVRGEILGFVKDELLRKHLPRMFSLIKNES